MLSTSVSLFLPCKLVRNLISNKGPRHSGNWSRRGQRAGLELSSNAEALPGVSI